jgi:hypothetical protein
LCWILLVAPVHQATPIFNSSWLKIGTHQQIWTKNQGICGRGHETISAASRPLNVLHIGLMSDAAWLYWILVAPVHQAMPIFDGDWLMIGTHQQIWTKNQGICGHVKPYQLPPDP